MIPSFFTDVEPCTLSKSVTGSKHLKSDKPCQDNNASLTKDTYTVLAVADGLGSAEKSQVGSRVATENAVEILDEYIQDALNSDDIKSVASIEKSLVVDMLQNVIKHARKAIEEHAECNEEPLEKYHTTLTVVIHTPFWYGVCAVGDSGVIAASNEGYYPLLDREDTESSTATVPITGNLKLIDDKYRLRFEDAYIPLITAFTDGFDRFVWSVDDRSEARPEFFDRLTGFVEKTDYFEAINTRGEFSEFVKSDHFDEHDADDKTLAISYIPFVDGVVSDDFNCVYSDKQFVNAIRSQQPVTITDVADFLDSSQRTVERRFNSLHERKIIEPTDTTTDNDTWQLTDNVSLQE